MAPKLELLGLNEVALPGRFLLTDVHSTNKMIPGEMEAYWPVLVLDRFLAPSKVEQGQQYPLVSINNDEYLIWLIGKRRFFWVNQDQLYQPHSSQLDALRASISENEFKDEFKSIFQIGMQNDAAGILDIFQDQIMADVTRINRAESTLQEGDRGIQATHRVVKRALDDPNPGRNMRAGSGMSSFQNRSSTARTSSSSMLPDTPSTQPTEEADPAIKQEPNEGDLLPRSEKVRILIGPRNTEFTSSKLNIAKSPLLTTYLISRPGTQSFIMHPNLKDIFPRDFKSIIDFLRTDSYPPTLTPHPSHPGTFTFDRLRGCDELAEVQRAGRLHVLAKTFRIPAMVDYIFQRLTRVRYATVVLEGALLLQLANTVFGRNTEPDPHGGVKEEETQGEEDALDEWLISRIVEGLEQLTTRSNTSALFWVVMHAGKGRGLSAKIFERRAERDRRMQGTIKIEDD